MRYAFAEIPGYLPETDAKAYNNEPLSETIDRGSEAL